MHVCASILLLLLLGVRLRAQDTCSADSGCSNQGTNYLLVGNPGVGKSTILNGIAGKTLFQSGPTFGKGMTTVLQAESIGDNTYMDTPGLADIELRKQAAREIEAALKRGGDFKIFFVVTLESGRIKPADRSTMQLVLEAAPIKHYAVIINKLEPEELEMIMQNIDGAREHILLGLMNGLPEQTLHFHFAERKQYLVARRNQALDLDEEFESFIENVPSVKIASPDVNPIKVDEFDALTEKFEAMISTLREDKEYLRKKLDEQNNIYKDIIMRMQEDNLRIGTRLDEAVMDKDPGQILKPLIQTVLPTVIGSQIPNAVDMIGRAGKGVINMIGRQGKGGSIG